MIVNTVHNTNPCFFHAPGRLENSPLWNDIIAFEPEIKFDLPSEISLFTWNSAVTKENYIKKLGTLEESLKPHKIKIDVLSTQEKWNTNRIKIELTVNYLNSIETKYVLGADSSDIVLKQNPNKILDLFKIYGGKIIFNAEKNFWKPDILKECYAQENIKYKDCFPFKYLNSGLWISELEYAKIFFQKALDLTKNLTDKELKLLPYSEQACIKKIASTEGENVQIDHKCIFFQCLNKVNNQELKIKKTKIKLI